MRVRYSKLKADAACRIERRTDGALGFDLYALDDYELNPGEADVVNTGLVVEVPQGLGMFVFPRSGLSSRYPNYLKNCVGVVDQDYRGEILVPIVNNTMRQWNIKAGDRIAQAVFLPVVVPELVEVGELTATRRGTGGFGSTGR